MRTLLQDLRYGARMLIRNPGFTVVAVITLALGIGANTAIFSVVDSVLLRPLPYPSPERLVMVWDVFSRQGLDQSNVSAPEFLDYRERNHAFEQIAAFRRQNLNLTGTDQPERLMASLVSAGFFTTLGIRPLRGRTFLAGEDAPGADAVAVLSHGLWQRSFGGDPGIIGKTVTLNGRPFTVVGIMPAGFDFPGLADVWVPLVFTNEPIWVRDSRPLRVIARLKPDASISQAQAGMDTIARQLQAQYPGSYAQNSGWGIRVVSLEEQTVGRSVRRALHVLLGAVACLLLIACANVANLLLARASARDREIAVRAALGAGRGRLFRQLLTEGQLLAVAGAALGALLAKWGIEALRTLIPAGVPRLQTVSVDGRVLAFTAAVAVATGLVFAVAPALRASKVSLSDALKSGGRGSTMGIAGGRMRAVLVVAEVGLAVMLLIGAGLLLRSFQRLYQVNPGFDPENVLTFSVSLPASEYPQKRQVAAFYDQLLEKLGALPGVQAAGVIAGLPLGGDRSSWGFTTEERPVPAPDQILQAQYRVAGPHYFRAMGITLVKGRDLTHEDNAKSPGVVVINETMARRFWPGQDPIGRRIKLGSPERGRTWDAPWLTVAGVIGDVRFIGLDSEPDPEMYVSYRQNPWEGLPEAAYMTLVGRAMTVTMRSSGDAQLPATVVRDQVKALNTNLPVFNLQPMEQFVSNSVAQPRFRTLLLGIFAAVALLLAATGIYGVMSYAVMQRTNEIGVRLALGARPADVLRLILGKGMALAGIGLALGVAGALALARLLTGLLFGIGPGDPATFAGIAALLSAVALLACYLPARRATKVDPMVALRYE